MTGSPDDTPSAEHVRKHTRPAAAWWLYGLAALMAIMVLAIGFSRDFRLPGLYMDSINPEYMAVRAVVDDSRPDTPVLVLPGSLIAGKYPVLAGSYYHGPLQYYVALPVYALLGTDLAAARIVQLNYGVLVLLAMALVLLKARVAPAFAAAGLALLALDPAFVLSLKTQAYNVTWPLAWLLLAVAVVEHWSTRQRPPSWRQSLATGLLAGIAFFCYFVFLFFVPALAVYLGGQLRAVGARGWKATSGVLALHGAGFAAGGGLYLWGYQRSAAAMGGWDRLIAGFRGTVESFVVRPNPATLSEKFATSWRSIRMALDDEWVSRMVLKAPGSDLLGDAKLALLLLVPIVLLVALRRMGLRSRLLEACMLAAVSYAVIGTLVVGTRMGPYHFALLLPLFYLGIAAGLSTAWPRLRATAGNARLATRAGVTVLCLVLVVDGIAGHRAFSAKLRQTGGVGYYNEAVTTYAERALAAPGETAYHFPTWGLLMPFVYLTGGREVTRMQAPTADQVRAAVCNGSAVEVAYALVDGAAEYAARTGAETGLEPSLHTLDSRDGRPNIAVVRFEANADAANVPGCDSYRPRAYQSWARDPGSRIELSPREAGCAGAHATTHVSWDVSAAASGRSVSLWVKHGLQRRLWAKAGPTGEASTGPWSSPGLRFEVVDGDEGAILATATLGGGPCP